MIVNGLWRKYDVLSVEIIYTLPWLKVLEHY